MDRQMMTTPYPHFIDYLRPISLFLGLPILICGLLGNCLCIVVFLSLKTFRDNACSFYLTCTCLLNIGHLLTGFLNRLMVNGFDIDWTLTSLFYCKFRWYVLQFCVSNTLTYLCLATWDQYLSTSTWTSMKKYSNLRIAHRLAILSSAVWFLHGIPFAVTMNIQDGSCIFTNNAFNNYFRKCFLPVFFMLLPIFVMITFSILSVRNIRKMKTETTKEIGRHALDRQLTKMLLIQVLFIATSTLISISHYTFILNVSFPTTTALFEQQFVAAILNIVWNTSYSASFYIYYWCSPRFRKQFHHVFFKMHFERCRRFFYPSNPIAPNDIQIQQQHW